MAPRGLLDHVAIAAELRVLAGQPQLAGRRAELDELAAALDGRGDPGPWAELDLLHTFVRPESVLPDGRPEARFWSLVEVGIGALVFVPLLVTWFGLMRATSAYQALIGSDPRQAGRPFLQLWQTGFDGRLGSWATFGHVAAGASAVIGLLLVLSVVHGLKRSGAERREAESARAADAVLGGLTPLLTRAQVALHEYRRASPQRFAAELTGAAQTLERLGEQAVRAQRELGSATETARDAVAAAREQLADVGAAVSPLQAAVGGVERAAGRVEQAVAAGAERVAETVRDGAAATDGQVDRSGRRMAEAADAVRDSADAVGAELADAGSRVEEAVRDLVAAQRGFATGAEIAADVSGRVLERLDDLTRRVADLGEQVARASSAALAAARHADDTARRAEDAARQADDSARQADDTTRRAAERLREQASAAASAAAPPSAEPSAGGAREHPAAPAGASTSLLDAEPLTLRKGAR
ncbi:hypothetical protein [Streptomyces sp. NRRL B-24484]|uniref:hypothetical protein n=1 Tax=Streptomyces sp. NRRL B-24484 TaxID=1463833 RepID=UPI000693ED68|nr:hypothetical protein [Streptomyces sp. NRRL B-24484]